MPATGLGRPCRGPRAPPPPRGGGSAKEVNVGDTPSGDGPSVEARPELRVYLRIENLAPQFAAYLSTPVRARGYPPMEGDESLIIEVAPALSIHRIVDLALKAVPDMEPGILYTERQFGLLELHSSRS